MPSKVLQAFNLQVCTVSRLDSDPSSKVLLVKSKGSSFVVKRLRVGTRVEQVRTQIELQQALRSGGFSYLPGPLDEKIDEMVLDDQGRIWLIARYVPADPPFDWTGEGWSLAHCGESARVLASLHSVSYKLLQQGFNPPLPSAGAEFFLCALDEVAEKLVAVERFSERFSAVRARLAAWSAQLRERMTRSLEVISRQSGPRVIVHGDYHPGNLLFRDAKAVALLDLEYASTGSSVVDTAYAITMLFGSRVFESGLNLPAVECFLAAYSKALVDELKVAVDMASNAWCDEFIARFDLSAFLMILWAVKGMYDSQSESTEPIDTSQFERGAELGLFLLSSDAADSVASLIRR